MTLDCVIDADPDQCPPLLRELAARLDLPIARHHDQTPFALGADGQGLYLAWPGHLKKPLRLDFDSGRMGYRLRGNRPRHELLAKAVGFKHEAFSILDATAGLGRDSALLACLGLQVTAVETHPIVHALLSDALSRSTLPALHDIDLQQADSRAYMETLPARPEVVYLDPMFGEEDTRGQVQGELQLMRRLLHDQGGDAAGLLETALETATKRVVVKRGLQAPPLPGPPPHHSHQGRSTRFDVYMVS